LHAPHVGMYVCGPTVYGDPHLGHARPAITFDILFRYLRHLGYKVRYVRNITDVGHLEHDADEGDDKIEKKARLEQLEPMEIAYIDVPEEATGAVIQKLTQRKGTLNGMSPLASGYTRLEFEIPSRGLIGYRGEFLTDTKGNGILNTEFEGYGDYRGDLNYRHQGSLIAFEQGEAVTYGLFQAQNRGVLFIGPGEKVYSGMVIGQSPKSEDIELNVCKTKHLSNTRTSSSDEALKLVPKKIMSLEQCIDFIDTDELLEVTPENLRIRKKILDPTARKRAGFNRK